MEYSGRQARFKSWDSSRKERCACQLPSVLVLVLNVCFCGPVLRARSVYSQQRSLQMLAHVASQVAVLRVRIQYLEALNMRLLQIVSAAEEQGFSVRDFMRPPGPVHGPPRESRQPEAEPDV